MCVCVWPEAVQRNFRWLGSTTTAHTPVHLSTCSSTQLSSVTSPDHAQTRVWSVWLMMYWQTRGVAGVWHTSHPLCCIYDEMKPKEGNKVLTFTSRPASLYKYLMSKSDAPVMTVRMEMRQPGFSITSWICLYLLKTINYFRIQHWMWKQEAEIHFLFLFLELKLFHTTTISLIQRKRNVENRKMFTENVFGFVLL